MRIVTALLFLAFLSVLGGPVAAQSSRLDPLEVQQSGQDYLDTVRNRRVETEMGYFDPNREAPSLDVDQEIPENAGNEVVETVVEQTFSQTGRWTLFTVFALILAGLLFLIVVQGGRLPVAFKKAPENTKSSGDAGGYAVPKEARVPATIEAVLNMADRRDALVSLCKALLARTVASEGVLLQDSWTDRDTLRRVPRTMPQFEALRALVFASERVQFGGRDVTEDEFQSHVRRLSPIWQEGAA